jgi:hypothetical protein
VTMDLLALSDERDAQLQLRLEAYREGWQDGARNEYSRGYSDAVSDMKSAQHQTGQPYRPGGQEAGRSYAGTPPCSGCGYVSCRCGVAGARVRLRAGQQAEVYR